eukprot:TRINITY_DN80937_c0_g1_i1.p1 TRINITY_DN80937_c0_g1~~TRINITY_DN80937_c0_g1_i1.p1  ORF type:complete len:239 (+),score=34.53 TRINITY_DN80937_c0_g1_i1:30-719(+)
MVHALPSDFDMACLQERITALKDRPIVPFLIIGCMMPGQRLEFQSKYDHLERLMEQGEVGVIGDNGDHLAYSSGVTGNLRRLEHPKWELRAGRLFRVLGPLERDIYGVPWGRIEFVKDEVAGEDQEVAKQLRHFVHEWQEVVEGSKFERFEGQIKQNRDNIGPMPSATDAGALALWVAALIYPLPELGLGTYDIRPAVLMAPTVHERLKMVMYGIKASIDHAKGRKPLL